MSLTNPKVKTTFVVYGKEFPAYSIGVLFLFVTIFWGLFGAFILALFCYGIYKAGDGRTIKTTVPIEIVDARDDQEDVVNDGNRV